MNRRSQSFSVFLAIIFVFLTPNLTRADTLGQKVYFFVDSGFDKYSRNQIPATLRYVSDQVYFYVDDSYWNGLDTAHQSGFMNGMVGLAQEFGNNIYPKETVFWGSEPNPGVDGDSRITILLEQLITGNGGYFNTGNEYTLDKISNSNIREMIYLSTDVVSMETTYTKAFLAHEFQHLISFNQKELLNKSTEDTWLNELRSEYSISVAGYNDPYYNSSLNRRVISFLENPSDSLTEWPNETADYGIASVFAEYLVEQYGRNILSETLKMYSTGISSLNNFLRDKGYHERFSDVFLRWMAAVYLNNTAIDSHYGYIQPELQSIRVRPQQSVFLSSGSPEFTSSHLIKNWQPIWLEYNIGTLYSTSAKSIKIDISGQSDQNFLASYITFSNDGGVRVDRLPIVAGRGTGYISNSGSGVNKVVVLATNGTKLSQFNTQETQYSLSVKVALTDTVTVDTPVLRDGVLVKKPIEKEIYVLWGKYKRYLAPGVIALYGHLDPANAIEVSPDPDAFFSYTTSNYVKYVNDPKVYAIWPDGTRHWLNITPQQWDASGRDWNAIFVINELELNYYKTGADITR